MSNYAFRGWVIAGFVTVVALFLWRTLGHPVNPVIAVSAFMCISTCGAIVGVLLEEP